ncbi:MAG TPA: response regulator [Beijerinckiaceae bacterium]|nr:response regulator [Beijerinckiaceae bacterium]
MQPTSGEAAILLICDDEALLRAFAADALQDAGYRVLEARDGAEALAILNFRDDVVAVFTDVAMPVMNGIMLATIVRARWPHIGVVVTSGALPDGARLELPPGARFIRKPYTAGVLVAEIRAVLAAQAGAAVSLQSIPTLQPGKPHGAGGIAQPLSEPDE